MLFMEWGSGMNAFVPALAESQPRTNQLTRRGSD